MLVHARITGPLYSQGHLSQFIPLCTLYIHVSLCIFNGYDIVYLSGNCICDIVIIHTIGTQLKPLNS